VLAHKKHPKSLDGCPTFGVQFNSSRAFLRLKND